MYTYKLILSLHVLAQNKLIDTKHEDDAARGVWNKSQDVEVRKMREVLKVLVEAGDKTEFDINLNYDLTTLTTEERNRGVGNLLVVAVLVAGVTFAGAITVPGSDVIRSYQLCNIKHGGSDIS
uniref:Uncharacterized protein n=1 Tax=Populus trichocarpa TaxID=3694 RepID=A0A3N7G6M4_POPTR|eukprot:XP_024445927.1 uncharacterized protein LOC112325014 isoform X3 [Populus trichocarpa]